MEKHRKYQFTNKYKQVNYSSHLHNLDGVFIGGYNKALLFHSENVKVLQEFGMTKSFSISKMKLPVNQSHPTYFQIKNHHHENTLCTWNVEIDYP